MSTGLCWWSKSLRKNKSILDPRIFHGISSCYHCSMEGVIQRPGFKWIQGKISQCWEIIFIDHQTSTANWDIILTIYFRYVPIGPHRCTLIGIGFNSYHHVQYTVYYIQTCILNHLINLYHIIWWFIWNPYGCHVNDINVAMCQTIKIRGWTSSYKNIYCNIPSRWYIEWFIHLSGHFFMTKPLMTS